MFALGQDFFAAGMLDRSESVFQELLDSDSKWITKDLICESLRTIYEQTQEWEKAIEATKCTISSLKKSNSSHDHDVNLNSLITHYYCELADEALQKGNLHEVDGFIVKAKKSYKQSTRLMSLQGDIAFHQKQYKQSLNHYLKAIKQDSRLLSMLFDKLDESASNADDIQFLQKTLLKMFQENEDNNLFEAILSLAEKYGADQVVDILVDDALSTKKLSIRAIYKASAYLKDRKSEQGKVSESSDNALQSLDLVKVNQSIENHLQGVPSFLCEHCGYKMHDYLWRCPACNHWDTIDQS